MSIEVHVYHHLVLADGVAQSIESLRSLIVTTKEEVLAELADIKAQVDATAAQNTKANAEISAAITANSATVATLTQQVADLQAQIATGGADMPPEIISAVAALKVSADAAKATSQALDDLNPDSAA